MCFKNFFSIFVTVFVCSVLSHAQNNVPIGNLYYNLNPSNKTAEVTYFFYIHDDNYYPYYSDYAGDIVIPSEVSYEENTYTVTSIGPAFGYCYGLTSVTIPNSVTKIYYQAFYGSPNLKSVVIGNSVSEIGDRAFANLDNLTNITCKAENLPVVHSTAFENTYLGTVALHVPYASLDAYKAIEPWKDFKEIVPIEGTEPVYIETCTMPTITFIDGKLVLESETDGAECHYEIKVEDAKEGVGSEVILSSAYEISVYASKEGFNDSEKNIVTIYWINVDPTTTGVIENEMRLNTNAILVKNTGGTIVISGVADGDNVLIYNISGQLIAQGMASGNYVEIGTNLSSGDMCIIKIGDKSVKYIMR